MTTTNETIRVRRVLGAQEEILEGHGLTRLNEPFPLPRERALRLVQEGPRFQRVDAEPTALAEAAPAADDDDVSNDRGGSRKASGRRGTASD